MPGIAPPPCGLDSRRRDAVGHQGLVAAEADPRPAALGHVQEVEDALLVVALQQVDLEVLPPLQPDQGFQDLGGLRAAVDVVAEEDQNRPAALGARGLGNL